MLRLLDKKKGKNNITTNRIYNMEGKRFGKLVVQKLVPIKGHKKFKNGWLCKCDCGNEKVCQLDPLINGFNKTCGKCPRNTYEFYGDYVIGYGTNGLTFEFDLEDYKKVYSHTWRVIEKTKVVYTTINKENIPLHKLITGTNGNQVVDHRDGNPSNNRKSNLRNATSQENSFNLKLKTNNTSGITGVWYDKNREQWVAEIKINQRKTAKRCNSFIDAVIQRVKWEFKYFGEFRSDRNDAKINTILGKYNLSVEKLSKEALI